jgi:hypothetical protein
MSTRPNGSRPDDNLEFPPLGIHVDVQPRRIQCDRIGKAGISRIRARGRIGRMPPATLRKVETIQKRLLEL